MKVQTVFAIRKGCDVYYTGILDKPNYSPERVIEDLAYGGGTKQYSDYNGPLEGKVLDFFFSSKGNTLEQRMYFWAIPYKEEKRV